MLRETFGTGVTVEAAIEEACKAIGLEREQVEIEIINMPVKKTLGLFGGSPAKVRVYVDETPVELARTFLSDIFGIIGLKDYQLSVNEEKENAEMTLDGEELGFLIGRRGETLNALQYLTGLIANKGTDNYYRITINFGDYREKREKTLTSLARRMAIQASKTGQNKVLEPMNPYERRIIHTAVQQIQGALSWSEGNEENRHVVIGPDKANPYKREGYRPARPGDSRRSGSPHQRQGNDRRPFQRGDRTKPVTVPKNNSPQNEKPEVPLYGRVD